MVDGFEGIPVEAAAQRLGIGRSQVRYLVKVGILQPIYLGKKQGRWERYHIDEASLKNYKKQHRAQR